jgi:protein-tyrosine phosphatase
LTPLSVTFVCTGNRFRSPLAELLLRNALDPDVVSTESMGTLDLGPVPPLPEAIAAARRFGLDLSSHRARSLRGSDLSGRDLVIGFERMHVITAVVDAKAPRDRTFTFPELVGLLAYGPSVSSVQARIGEAAARRPDDPDLESIPQLADPLGRSHGDQKWIADEIDRLVRLLASLLFGR